MRKIVFATHNPGKIKEINEIVKNMKGFDNIEVVSMKDVGITDDIVENGDTYKDNALIKADFVHKRVKDYIVLAEDSGFEVEALGNKPGLFSARFMGEDTSYDIKNKAIIEAVYDDNNKDPETGEYNTKAQYVCCIGAITPDGDKIFTYGIMTGTISRTQKGDNGFGYDPIFYVNTYKKTAAEMNVEEKNAISHRGCALRNMMRTLKENNFL